MELAEEALPSRGTVGSTFIRIGLAGRGKVAAGKLLHVAYAVRFGEPPDSATRAKAPFGANPMPVAGPESVKGPCRACCEEYTYREAPPVPPAIKVFNPSGENAAEVALGIVSGVGVPGDVALTM